MKIEFKDPKLADLYQGIKVTDKKYRYDEPLLNQFRKTVRKLESANNIEQLFQFTSLNYEKLKGNLKSKSSVRINIKYRLIFEEILNEKNPKNVEILALEEISKHYE